MDWRRLWPVRRKYIQGTGPLVFSFKESRLHDPDRPGLKGDHDKSVPEIPADVLPKTFKLHVQAHRVGDPEELLETLNFNEIARSGLEARIRVQNRLSKADTHDVFQVLRIIEVPPRG